MSASVRSGGGGMVFREHVERRFDYDDGSPMPASVSPASGRYPQRTDESQPGLRSSALSIANCRHRDRDDSRRRKQWPRVLDRSKTWQLSGVFEGPLSWWSKQKNRDGASRRVGNSSDPNRLGPRRRSAGGSIGGLCGQRGGRRPIREFTTPAKILVALNCKGGRLSFEIAEFVRNSGSPVAYYPRLAIALGGVKEAVFVCQFLYWEGKQSDSERWIHKSLEEIRSETGLSRYEQEGVRRTLEKAGILESRYERLEHRLYFRVNLARLSDCWEAQYPCSETPENNDSPSESGKAAFGKTESKPAVSLANAENQHSGMRKTNIGECGKSTFGNAENQHSFNRTENTMTAERARGRAGPNSSEEKKSSSLALADKLARDFRLSRKQQQIIADYCESNGEAYVLQKVEIVSSEPRGNAAKALLAALRDDWQPPIQCNPRSSNEHARLEASRALAKRMEWTW